MKIFKYELKTSGETILQVPKIYQTMDLQVQHNRPVIWVACDPSQGYHEKIFLCKMTGAEIADISKYLGTVTLDGGSFVCHYFYK